MLHIWFTSGEQSSGTLSEEKQNVHTFIQVYKRRKSGKWKILKNEAAEKYLGPCQISIMEHFCHIDVWYSSKYTPVVVLVSKIYLKEINKYQNLREKCAFLQRGPSRGYVYLGMSQDIRSGSSHIYY